jgi:hypothetical protein
LTFKAEKYVKKLFGIRRVEDAFQRLDKLTQEEARMAEVEILTIAARIDENVIHVGECVNEGMERVHLKVVDMNDQLEIINTNVQGVGNDINKGGLFFYSPSPEYVLKLTRLGVTEATKVIQLVSKHVNEINR